MRKKIGIILVSLGVASCILGVAVTKGVKDKKYDKYINYGIENLNNEDFSKALKNLNEAKHIYGETEEIKTLSSILENYKMAKVSYENKNYEESKKDLEKIPPEYENYGIKEKINELKKNIKNVDKGIEKVKKEIEENKKIVKSEAYVKGIKNLIEIDKNYASKEEIDEINSIINEGEKSREQYKKVVEAEKKKKEEKEKKEKEEKEKKEKEEKEAKEKRDIVSKEFNLKFNIPNAWKGKYVIKTNESGIYIYMDNEKLNEGEGLLAQIVKGENVHGVDGKTVIVNGVKYTIGTRTDVGMSEGNKALKEYINLLKANGISTIIDSIKEI